MQYLKSDSCSGLPCGTGFWYDPQNMKNNLRLKARKSEGQPFPLKKDWENERSAKRNKVITMLDNSKVSIQKQVTFFKPKKHIF